MIEPVSDALTTEYSPCRNAMVAMISSAALPNVAFNRPPIPSPVWCANSSVAWPSQPASGMTARQEERKISVCAPGFKNSSPIATGTKMSSQFSIQLSVSPLTVPA